MGTRSQQKNARRQARKNAVKTRSASTSGAGGPAAPPASLATAVRGAIPHTQTGVTATAATTTVEAPVTGQEPRTQPAGGGCAAVVSEAGPHGLAATYWLDSGTSGSPYSVTVRFAGRRVGVEGTPDPGDRFDQVEQVEGIAPGSGRVAITTRVSGINQGEWRVTATPVRQSDTRHATTTAAKSGSRLPRRDLTVHTRLVALAYGPGVRPLLWPALVGLGVVVAILLQAVLLARANTDAAAAAVISVGASVVGFVSAKVWYLVQNRKHPRTFLQAGACIQGFLVGAIGVLALATAAFGLPLGTVVDASTPGIFLGMAIGRPGCWFTGCCTGRPTTSRWGMWSSDRRIGIRRIPIQLVEAALALLIGLTTLTLALTTQPPVAGALFLGAAAAYTLGRQALFPFRSEPRKTTLGRTLTTAASAVVLLAALAVSALG